MKSYNNTRLVIPHYCDPSDVSNASHFMFWLRLWRAFAGFPSTPFQLNFPHYLPKYVVCESYKRIVLLFNYLFKGELVVLRATLFPKPTLCRHYCLSYNLFLSFKQSMDLLNISNISCVAFYSRYFKICVVILMIGGGKGHEILGLLNAYVISSGIVNCEFLLLYFLFVLPLLCVKNLENIGSIFTSFLVHLRLYFHFLFNIHFLSCFLFCWSLVLCNIVFDYLWCCYSFLVLFCCYTKSWSIFICDKVCYKFMFCFLGKCST